MSRNAGSNGKKPAGGGLLKLNPDTMNEMVSKTDQLELSENRRRHDHRDRPRSSRQQNTEQFKEFKTLFNPDNPDKPIYVGINKANSAGRAQLPKSTSSNAEQASSPPTSSITNNKIPEPRVNANNHPRSNEINQVKSNCQKIQLIEPKVAELLNSFDLVANMSQFMGHLTPLLKQSESLCFDSFFIHIETSSTLGIDTLHWRCCYHPVIETLRKELSDSSHPSQARELLGKQLGSILNQAMQFYSQLVDNLEHKYLRFHAVHYVDLNYYGRCVQILSADPNINTITTITNKEAKYALTAINRVWISMGDLERYREMIFPSINSSSVENNTNQENSIDVSLLRDYSIARSYYIKAMALAPKSSRAYHQLAILALYTKKRLDTCYYYFRCLEVSQPINVRQSLNAIFEEARVKMDSINRMLKQAVLKREQYRKNRRFSESSSKSSKQNRVEIWHKPSFVNGSNSNQNKQKLSVSGDLSDDSDEDDDELDNYLNNSQHADEEEQDGDNLTSDTKLNVNELSKRFMLNYLNSIGKLFTKVGMESYPEVCSNMLKVFGELIKRRPCPLGIMRLLQITVINISIVDLNSKSTSSSLNTNDESSHTVSRSQQLEYSIQLAMDMFAVMAKRLNHLLRKLEVEEEYLLADENEPETSGKRFNSQEFSENKLEFLKLLPSIKVFTDWMLCHFNIWHPMPDSLPPDVVLNGGSASSWINLDRWKILVDMFNLINQAASKYSRFARIDPSVYRVKLEEDLELAGFLPLQNLPREDYNYSNSIKLSIEQISSSLNEILVENNKIGKRMDKIILLAEYLCGLEQPLLKYDVENKRYVSLVAQQTLRIERKPTNRTISTSSNSSLTNNAASHKEDQFSDNDMSSHSELKDLKERHRMLKAQLDEQTKKEKLNQIVLEESAQRRIEIEIRPKMIVADTNCYIDHLALLKKILKTSYYIIVVPLLVINELDKLAKQLVANANEDSVEHAEYVKKNARAAIQFLNEQFDKRERNIKAMTSQGSILETIQFRSEEIVKKGTNDDLILGCCLYYCRDNARDFMPTSKDDAIHLYREVILLTEDRHLRVKALSRNVPVKDIRHFCKWSNV